MAGQAQSELVSQVVDRFRNRAQQYADGIANRLGAPASGVKLNNDQIVQLWKFSPHPDPAGAYEQLTAQGMPPGQALDQVHPYRRKLFQAPTVGEQVKKAESIKAMAEGSSGTSVPQA